MRHRPNHAPHTRGSHIALKKKRRQVGRRTGSAEEVLLQPVQLIAAQVQREGLGVVDGHRQVGQVDVVAEDQAQVGSRPAAPAQLVEGARLQTLRRRLVDQSVDQQRRRQQRQSDRLPRRHHLRVCLCLCVFVGRPSKPIKNGRSMIDGDGASWRP